jgi:hypothetical protein
MDQAFFIHMGKVFVNLLLLIVAAAFTCSAHFGHVFSPDEANVFELEASAHSSYVTDSLPFGFTSSIYMKIMRKQRNKASKKWPKLYALEPNSEMLESNLGQPSLQCPPEGVRSLALFNPCELLQ